MAITNGTTPRTASQVYLRAAAIEIAESVPHRTFLSGPDLVAAIYRGFDDLKEEPLSEYEYLGSEGTIHDSKNAVEATLTAEQRPQVEEVGVDSF